MWVDQGIWVVLHIMKTKSGKYVYKLSDSDWLIFSVSVYNTNNYGTSTFRSGSQTDFTKPDYGSDPYRLPPANLSTTQLATNVWKWQKTWKSPLAILHHIQRNKPEITVSQYTTLKTKQCNSFIHLLSIYSEKDFYRYWWMW